MVRCDSADFRRRLSLAGQIQQSIHDSALGHPAKAFITGTRSDRRRPGRIDQRADHFIERWVPGIALVQRHEPRRTLRVQQPVDDLLRETPRRRHRIERGSSRARNQSERGSVASGNRRDDRRDAGGDAQRRRRKIHQHHSERPALLRRRNYARWNCLLARQRVAELHPAHRLGCGVQGVSVVQVHVGKAPVEHRERLARERRPLVEPLDQHPPHRHRPLERLERVGPLHPLRRRRIGS